MVSPVYATIGAAIALVTYTTVSNLRRNIIKARATGLKYIVLPVSPVNTFWQITFKFWVFLIKLFPKSLWEGWLFCLMPDWQYHTGQKYFEKLGETFISVSPGHVILWTQDADVIHQITQRREAFPKDIALYVILAMFGENLLTSEGADWRRYRKTTAAGFNEKNAVGTFAEAINQTQGLLANYFDPEAENSGTSKTINTLERDALIWALNIISYVGFGLRLLWPGQKAPKEIDSNMTKYSSFKPLPGHSMTFSDSVQHTLEKILVLLVVPLPILRLLPFGYTQTAYKSRNDYLQYMQEFLRDKAKEAQEGNTNKTGMDIMGSLVQSSYGPAAKSKESALTDDEIIGNAFIMFLAGHETTGNVIHFTLLMLAANPAAQRRLQQDVDRLFGNSDPKTWVYEQSINAMLGSHIGACINETLRLIPPVVNIPKCVSPNSDQTLIVKGKTHVLSAGTSIAILPVSVHRNPRFWPTARSEKTGAPTDLDDFLPERWYRTRTGEDFEVEADDKADYGGFKGSDTSDSLYRPIRGSFIPFSDGARACLGRRIAIVEMAAVLAVVFQKYSIELAVDEWASDDEVAKMTPAEKRALYAKAQKKTEDTLMLATSLITLKLHGGEYVPVRFVKRGHERFVNDVELS